MGVEALRMASRTRGGMGGPLSTTRSVLARRGPDLLAVALVFVAYTVTVWVALRLSFGAALVGGAANTVPVVIFGAIARHVMVTRLAGRSLPIQALGHVLLCAAFSLLSYWLLVVLLGVANGTSLTDFSVRSFSGSAVPWQLLEDVTTYAVLAALTHAQFAKPALQAETPAAANTIVPEPTVPERPAPEPAIAEPPAEPAIAAPAVERARSPEPSRYFTRTGEDVRPIDLERVVCIGGADDYAEVTTLDGRHLVRMTLSEFEQTLDPARFARVHRSWIVNLDCVERVEPAGSGRMLLHMTTGHAVPASRAGARSLRDRVI